MFYRGSFLFNLLVGVASSCLVSCSQETRGPDIHKTTVVTRTLPMSGVRGVFSLIVRNDDSVTIHQEWGGDFETFNIFISRKNLEELQRKLGAFETWRHLADASGASIGSDQFRMKAWSNVDPAELVLRFYSSNGKSSVVLTRVSFYRWLNGKREESEVMSFSAAQVPQLQTLIAKALATMDELRELERKLP